MPLGITGWLLIIRFSHFGFLQFILEICFIYIIFQDRLLSRHFSLHLIAGIPTKKLGWSVCGVAFKTIIQLATIIVFLWFNQHFYWRERSIVRRIALKINLVLHSQFPNLPCSSPDVVTVLPLLLMSLLHYISSRKISTDQLKPCLSKQFFGQPLLIPLFLAAVNQLITFKIAVFIV